jgi:hypothetical protein
VEQPKDLNLVSANPVDDEIVAVRQKFSGFWHPPGTAKLRESGEKCSFCWKVISILQAERTLSAWINSKISRLHVLPIASTPDSSG